MLKNRRKKKSQKQKLIIIEALSVNETRKCPSNKILIFQMNSTKDLQSDRELMSSSNQGTT